MDPKVQRPKNTRAIFFEFVNFCGMNYNQAMFSTLPLTIMLQQKSTHGPPGFQPNRCSILHTTLWSKCWTVILGMCFFQPLLMTVQRYPGLPIGEAIYPTWKWAEKDTCVEVSTVLIIHGPPESRTIAHRCPQSVTEVKFRCWIWVELYVRRFGVGFSCLKVFGVCRNVFDAGRVAVDLNFRSFLSKAPVAFCPVVTSDRILFGQRRKLFLAYYLQLICKLWV